jgi:polyphosphate kinase
LFQRVETCFPLEDAENRARVVENLYNYLRDNTQAWLLQRNGSYQRAEPGEAEPFSAQAAIAELLAEQA